MEEADISKIELLERIIKIEKTLEDIFNPKMNVHRKQCLVYCNTQMALPNVDDPPLEDGEIIEVFGIVDSTKKPVRFYGVVREYKSGEKRLKFKKNDLINKGNNIIVNKVNRKNEEQIEKNDTIKEKKVELDKGGWIKPEEPIEELEKRPKKPPQLEEKTRTAGPVEPEKEPPELEEEAPEEPVVELVEEVEKIGEDDYATGELMRDELPFWQSRYRKGNPWNEKYGPKTLDDVFGQAQIVDNLKIMKENIWASKDGDVPHLLLSGPTGVGKYTIAKAFMMDTFGGASGKWYTNYLELNATAHSSMKVVKKRLEEWVNQIVIGTYKTPSDDEMNFPFNVVLFNEFDHAKKKIQKYLGAIMDTHSNNNRFIIICKDEKMVIKYVKDHCLHFMCEPLLDEDIKGMLQKIAVGEGLSVSEGAIKKICGLVNGSARKAQDLLYKASLITSDIHTKNIEVFWINEKEKEESIDAMWE